MPAYRQSVSLALSFLLATACAPASLTSITPSAGQPAPQAPLETPQAPARPPAVAPAPDLQPLKANVIFPAGTLALLRAGLRTQAAVNDKDLSPADLAKLVVTIDGRQVPSSQFTFTGLQWDSAGGIRASLTINGESPPPGARISVALPTKRLTLFGSSTGGTATIEVSVTSTARALLQDAAVAARQAIASVSDEAVAIVADRLCKALLSTATADPLQAPTVTAAVQAITKSTGQGVPAAVLHTLPNLNPVATGGGGGGGGGSAPVVPAVTTVTPDNGPIGTTPALTIAGSHFADGSKVTIDGNDVTPVTVNAAGTEITLTVPAGLAARPHELKITHPNGQFVVLVAGYTVTEPTISGITPGTGDRGQATDVTIAGTHFAAGAEVTVGGVDATGVTVNADGTEITATVPAGLPPGAHDVVVKNVGGGTATATGAFTATGANPGVSVGFQPGQPFAGTPVVGSNE